MYEGLMASVIPSIFPCVGDNFIHMLETGAEEPFIVVHVATPCTPCLYDEQKLLCFIHI